MSTKLFIVIASLAAFAAAAVAMPRDVRDTARLDRDRRDPAKLDLATVMNKTVCPIKVEFDEDQNRVPKRIKVLKCERDPNLWCSKMHIPKHECCQHQHGDVRLECVEIQDTVQVYYPAEKETQQYRVSVGCTCVMERAGAVAEPAPAR